jgi:ABC-2 type transport system permease protein
MAVYEQTYQPYTGALTPLRSRFLVIARYAYSDLFNSKLATVLLYFCFIYPLVAAILIYLHHNAAAIEAFQIDLEELLPINASFFFYFMQVQSSLGFLLTLIVAPSLISRDINNNGLPLYLCRPLSRADYVLGKAAVLFGLLSIITWIPGLLLFLFQSYLEGFGWLASNLRIAVGIFVGSIAWITFLTLLALSLSAWVRWRLAASAALFGCYLIPAAIGQIVNEIFNTQWGNLIKLSDLFEAVWTNLLFFGQARTDIPVWSAWLMLVLISGLCLLMLKRKVRAYEVVR